MPISAGDWLVIFGKDLIFAEWKPFPVTRAKKNRNDDTAYAAELTDKDKQVKGKTNLKSKKDASKTEYIYYKKRYPTIKWTDHT